VEERKKAILEAEKERREAMLRRSEVMSKSCHRNLLSEVCSVTLCRFSRPQDRGMRQELKRRNEKSAIAFAFGSSTPRMLDPVETLSTSSYWGARRYFPV
jgi:MAP7 domain-containing protein 1